LHLGLCCAIFRILGFGSIFKIVQLDWRIIFWGHQLVVMDLCLDLGF
jgi:hypothetical protein